MAQGNSNSTAGTLQKLIADFAGVAGDLVEPIAMLAAGASKTEAAWAGFRGWWTSRVLGPLGMMTGVAAAVVVGIRNITKEWKELGMAGAANKEKVQAQFTTLLKSAELAKQKIKELNEWAAKSPFEQGETQAAARTLQTLTRGALSTKEGLTLVGDAAAAANVSLEDTARLAGRLYDALMSGRPIGEVAMRLQEVGLMSGQTRSQLESMVEAGAAGSEMWRVAQKELERNKGASERLGQTLEGLQSTYNDLKGQMMSGFAAGSIEGENAAMQAKIIVLEKMAGSARELGAVMGSLSNWFHKTKLAVVESVMKNELLVGAFKAVAVAGGVFAAAVKPLIVLIGVQKVAAYLRSAAASGTYATAEHALAEAKAEVALANAAILRGEALVAASHMKNAAMATRAAGGMKLAAGWTGIFSVALKGLRIGLGFIGRMLMLLVTPLVAWTAAASLAIGVIAVIAGKYIAAGQAVDAYRKATEEMVRVNAEALQAAQTLDEVLGQMADTLTRLAAAKRDYAKAAAEGDKDAAEAAQQRIDTLKGEYQKQRAEMSKEGRFRATEGEKARLDEESKQRVQAEKDAREREYANMDPATRAARAKEDLEKFDKAAEAAEMSRQIEADVKKAKIAREAMKEGIGGGGINDMPLVTEDRIAEIARLKEAWETRNNKDAEGEYARRTVEAEGLNQERMDKLDLEYQRLKEARDLATSPAERDRLKARADEAALAAEDVARNAPLEKERALLALRDDTIQAGLEMLDVERKLIENKRELTAEQKANELEVLAKREEIMKREVDESLRAARSNEALKRSRADLERRVFNGNPVMADESRREILDLEREQARMEAEQEARRAGITGAEKDAMVDGAGARVEEEYNREKTRREEEANADRAQREAEGLRAREERLRFLGRTRAADNVRAQAEAKEDEAFKARRRRELTDRGVDETDANGIVAGELQDMRAKRLMERLGDMRGQNISASSSRRIGGGGVVAGYDGSTRRMDEMIKQLREIAKNTQGAGEDRIW